MIPEETVTRFFSLDKAERAAASRILGKAGDEGVAFVLPYLSSQTWRLRYRACEVIGFANLPKYADCLIPGLSDENGHVRYMAVKSLGLIGTPEKYQERITPLLNDTNLFVARIAGKVLDIWKT